MFRPIIALSDRNRVLWTYKTSVRSIDMDTASDHQIAELYARWLPVLQERKVTPIDRFIYERLYQLGACTLIPLSQYDAVERRVLKAVRGQ